MEERNTKTESIFCVKQEKAISLTSIYNILHKLTSLIDYNDKDYKIDLNDQTYNQVFDGIRTIIVMKEGSILLQKIICHLDFQSLFNIYKIIEPIYINLLQNPYSSYFCQVFYCLLSIESREILVNKILLNLEKLIKNPISFKAIICLFELPMTNSSQLNAVRNFSTHSVNFLISHTKYLKILESLVSAFNQKNLEYILKLLSLNFLKFINVKQGIYLIKKFIKKLKNHQNQQLFIEILINNFDLLPKSLLFTFIKIILNHFISLNDNFTKFDKEINFNKMLINLDKHSEFDKVKIIYDENSNLVIDKVNQKEENFQNLYENLNKITAISYENQALYILYRYFINLLKLSNCYKTNSILIDKEREINRDFLINLYSLFSFNLKFMELFIKDIIDNIKLNNIDLIHNYLILLKEQFPFDMIFKYIPQKRYNHIYDFLFNTIRYSKYLYYYEYELYNDFFKSLSEIRVNYMMDDNYKIEIIVKNNIVNKTLSNVLPNQNQLLTTIRTYCNMNNYINFNC